MGCKQNDKGQKETTIKQLIKNIRSHQSLAKEIRSLSVQAWIGTGSSFNVVHNNAYNKLESRGFEILRGFNIEIAGLGFVLLAFEWQITVVDHS